MQNTDTLMGAEAEVSACDYLGLEAMRKSRPAKAYRRPELDVRIRSSRTRSEARIMQEARRAGVRTPCIYDVDPEDWSITMERIDGPSVKNLLDSGKCDAEQVCRLVGETVAKLHSAGICHGDLTTSNMLYEDGRICLIDFSMGCTKATMEDIGVDVRLLERAFTSAHIGLEKEFEALMETYYANVPDPDAVKKKVEDIRNRGRYT